MKNKEKIYTEDYIDYIDYIDYTEEQIELIKEIVIERIKQMNDNMRLIIG